FFKKPATGILRNQRQDPRFNLETYSPYLKAEIKISSQLGDFTFETRHLVDLSQDQIAMFLDRSQGLVLPGDKVVSMAVFHQNTIVLETEGVVVRTDMKRVSDQMKGSFFIVIRMKQPGPSSETARLGEGLRVDDSRAYVDGEHPILRGYGFSGQIQNVSTSGLCFTVEGLEIPLMAGLVLSELYIHIPPHDLHLKACVKVTQCVPEEGGDRHRVTSEFLGMSIELLKAINRLKDGAVDARLTEARREDFDQLLDFFFESGFIYSGKRKQLQKYASAVRKTNITLLQSGDAIMKKVLFKESREIKGHISALRFFDRAWLVQHMTTHHVTGPATSKAILSSIINFFMDYSVNRKMNTSYVTCYYRSGNLYPEVLFGETARVIANPEISGTADLDFCVSGAADSGVEKAAETPGVQCAEAGSDDLVRLERLLVEQGRYFLIRIEGLTAEGLAKLSVSNEYGKLGLYRHRKVFVARRTGEEEAVYAVCNYASPGCNLSELTNSFRLYYSPTRCEPDLGLVNTLARRVLDSYRATEMPSPVLLLEEGQPLPENFKKMRKYRYWYFDTAHVSLFKSTAESSIAHIKEILKRLKTENPNLKESSYEHA
ncbi:MAG TPA: PilZ domain-containing protein, partial [bacterium]|nr:PilZ domain-containing protein [bacterium]